MSAQPCKKVSYLGGESRVLLARFGRRPTLRTVYQTFAQPCA